MTLFARRGSDDGQTIGDRRLRLIALDWSLGVIDPPTGSKGHRRSQPGHRRCRPDPRTAIFRHLLLLVVCLSDASMLRFGWRPVIKHLYSSRSRPIQPMSSFQMYARQSDDSRSGNCGPTSVHQRRTPLLGEYLSRCRFQAR